MIYTYGAALQPEISTRSISEDEGFATAIGKPDHVGRLSGRRPMGLALLGEMDAVSYHGRISGLGLLTDCDFGESTGKWQQAGDGGYSLIFVLRPATTRSEGTVATTNVDLQTFGQDGPAAHGRLNRVCLFSGRSPKENEIKNSTSAKTLSSPIESTGRGREEAVWAEGVWRYCAFVVIKFTNSHVQDQRAHGSKGLRRTDIVHHVEDGRRTGCFPRVGFGITEFVCSSYVIVFGIHNSRLLTPLHCAAQFPCWEARFSGWRGLARPASCLVSGCHWLARKRGTPGSISPQLVSPVSMEATASTSAATADATMAAATTGKRYSDTVSSFHLFDLPEWARTSALAPLFMQEASFPMSGPFFIRGVTEEDAKLLTLRMTRAATPFTLLVDVGCKGPAATAMDRLLLQRQEIILALQGIDGANGRSVKAGASPSIFSSLTVDKDGRAAESGTNLASFHLNRSRHIQQQSTSAYTWELLQRLVDRKQGRVTDYPSWHDTQRLRAAQSAYEATRAEIETGRWACAEQHLLALTSSLQGGSTFLWRARELVEASRRAVSAYLLDAGSHQAELAAAATQSLSHRLDDVAQL